MAATGVELFSLFCLCISRWLFISFNSADKWDILSRIILRSVSIFFSPGPLVPIPPPSLDSVVPRPASLVDLYLSCAISTCILPSLDDALAANISNITIVLSIIFVSRTSSRFLNCAGDSSSSHIIPVAPSSCIIALNSSSFPFPI